MDCLGEGWEEQEEVKCFDSMVLRFDPQQGQRVSVSTRFLSSSMSASPQSICGSGPVTSGNFISSAASLPHVSDR